MRNSMSFASLRLALLVGLVAMITGCSRSAEKTADAGPPPYEGKYKNARGNVVLEIREGRAIFTNPQSGAKSDTTVQASGNNLSVESSAGNFTMKFNPPDSITGMPAAIAGDSGPLKKVQ